MDYGGWVKNGDRRVRRLIVGDAVWRWTVRQRGKGEDCCLRLSLFREGVRGRLVFVFCPGVDRVVSNTYFEAGTVVRLPDRVDLNLFEPGTVRRLLDAAAVDLDLDSLEHETQLDGWPYFDRVVSGFGTTPEEASRGRVVADAELPMLAAQWLVEGFDSPLLRELAGLSRRQSSEAREMFEAVLAELGFPVVKIESPYEQLPWRGCWDQVRWAVDQVGTTHTAYASAQRVLEVLSDVPGLWGPGHGTELLALLQQWDEHRDQRSHLSELIRTHLYSLRESDVPPLR